MINEQAQEHRDHRFLIGLISGAVLGVGAVVVGSRLVSGLCKQVADSVDSLGRRAEGVRDEMCDTVARGAQKVERFATEAKTEHPAETGTPSAAHR
jgi:hypothetical protein